MSGSCFSGIPLAVIWRTACRAVKWFVSGRLIAVALLLFIIHNLRPRSPLGMERDAQQAQ